jgi:hypothetical protein
MGNNDNAGEEQESKPAMTQESKPAEESDE